MLFLKWTNTHQLVQGGFSDRRLSMDWSGQTLVNVDWLKKVNHYWLWKLGANNIVWYSFFYIVFVKNRSKAASFTFYPELYHQNAKSYGVIQYNSVLHSIMETKTAHFMAFWCVNTRIIWGIIVTPLIFHSKRAFVCVHTIEQVSVCVSACMCLT